MPFGIGCKFTFLRIKKRQMPIPKMAIAENLLSDAKAPSADAKVIIIAITKMALLRCKGYFTACLFCLLVMLSISQIRPVGTRSNDVKIPN